MYFELFCPHCSQRVKVKEQNEGKTGRCPCCGERMKLERPRPQHVPPPLPVAAGQSPREDSEAWAAEPWLAETAVEPPAPPLPGEWPCSAAQGVEPPPVPRIVVTDEVPFAQPKRGLLAALSPAGPRHYHDKPNGTNVGFLKATGLGLLLMGGWYAAVVLPLHATYFGKLFLNRGWVPHAIALLTCWSVAALLLKAYKLNGQRKSLSLDLLPSELSPEIRAENVEQFQAHIRESCESPKHSFVARRVLRALEYFKARGNAEEVAAVLGSQAEADAASVESSYTMVRVLIWAIPILGFIGTVVGISGAVSQFAGSIQGAEDLAVIKDSLGQVTSNLAYAFDTTLVALVMSVLLMIPASSMQKSEEDLLNSVDEYCNEKLLERLRESAEEPRQQDPQLLKEAVAEALGEHEERFGRALEMLKTVGSAVTEGVADGWAEIHAQLQTAQSNHVEQLRELSQSIAGGRERFLAEWQSAGDRQADKLAGTLDSLARRQAATAARLQAAQQATLEGIGRLAASMAEQTARLGEELSSTRSAIASSAHVAEQLRQSNETAQQRIDELVDCFGDIVGRQQKSAAAQQALAVSLKRMVTTDAFGEMLSGMNASLNGLLAATSGLNDQVEKLAAERPARNGRGSLWGRLLSRDRGNGHA